MGHIHLLSPTHLSFQDKTYRCATGAGGIRFDKCEGDKATPVGTFGLVQLFYRPDKFDTSPETNLPTHPLTQTDGWCDDPQDLLYNHHIQRPYPAHHEHLWRDDEVYDLIITTTHNTHPTLPGHGSAIFVHIARPDYSPTEGCIALERSDLLGILRHLTPTSRLIID